MKRHSTGYWIGFAALACVSLVAAFVIGRGFPAAASGKEMVRRAGGAGSHARDVRTPTTWREAWDAPTAAGRTLAVLDLLDRCQSNDDFRAATATVQADADKSEKQRFLALLFAAWLEADPLAALSEVRRVEMLRHDAGRVAESFRIWALSDPDAAADLLSRVLDGRQGDAASKPPFLDGIDPPDFLLSVVSGLGMSNPALAAETLAAAADSPVRTSGVEVLLQQWYADAPGAVRSWASAITETETRRIALAATAVKAGQHESLEPALEWAMNLPSAEDRLVALVALTGQWSQRHAADAFTWTRALPDGELKFTLMPGVLRQFVIIDPGAAADWLNLYDAAPAMDASVAAYAKAIQFTNLPAAIGSAESITDPRLRETVIRRLERNARQRGPGTDRSGP